MTKKIITTGIDATEQIRRVAAQITAEKERRTLSMYNNQTIRTGYDNKLQSLFSIYRVSEDVAAERETHII